MDPSLGKGDRCFLVILWVPSADRAGTPIRDQEDWKDKSLRVFGELFGGATAIGPVEGVWRDDEAGGTLIQETPILVEAYVREDQINDAKIQRSLGTFCRRMGKATKQAVVALLMHDQFHLIAAG